MIGFIFYLLVIGLIAGFLARALVPGRDPMSVGQTIILGIVGSFVGGFIGYVLFGADASEGAFQASGIVGSIVGAVIALLVYRRIGGRSGRGLGAR
ncbi:MAG: GlsB/YeaQ/YmgE family stress response membrane protein [Acidimicrobiales bacterium]